MRDGSEGTIESPHLNRPARAGLDRIAAQASLAALLAVIAFQVAGPSDLFHQTQPRTISYTADIALNGRWVLPLEQGELPATKPPFYNWLAAPVVRLLGFDSEFAHKLPSILALAACWWMTTWIGRSIDVGSPARSAVGALAGLAVVTTYTIHKLGYLARPDMLLTLWLTAAWWAATEVILRSPAKSSGRDDELPASDNSTTIEEASSQHPSIVELDQARRMSFYRLVFWTAIALAWLTKGPVALLPVGYALVGARLLRGGFSAASGLGWKWGLPLSLAPFVAWIIAAYDIDRDHVVTKLWWDEFLGRVLGHGPETADQGPIGLLTSAYAMPYYFLVRSAPWSILAVATMVVLWLRRRNPENRLPDARLRAAALWILFVLAFFTLSAGKRADYIAAAYPASSILAAWLLIRFSRSMARALGVALGLAAATLAVLILADWREWTSPFPRGYGRSTIAFVERASAIIDSQPRPIAFWRMSDMSLQTLLGANQPHSTEHLVQTLRRHERLWLIAGEREGGDDAEAIDLEKQSVVTRFNLTLTPVVSSDDIPGGALWPRTATLFRVEGEGRRRRARD